MTHQSYLETKFFRNLDGIRALSILAVLWHHCTDKISFGNLNIFHQGNHGVTLFFVLSGFLITTLLLREKKKNGTVNLKNFYIRRTLRIFPLYYFVIICLYVPAVYFLESDPNRKADFWNNLPFFLTYTGNIFARSSTSSMIFLYSWSLALEEQFYLFWPTVEKVFSKKIIPIIIVMILLLQYQPALFAQFQISIFKYSSTAIFMGVLSAHLLNNKQCYSLLAKPLSTKYSFLISLIGLLFALELRREGFFIDLFSCLLVVSAVINHQFFGSKLLQSKLLIEIGKVSYGIYLYHMLCINLIKKLTLVLGVDHFLITFFFSSVLAFIISKISFTYLESYFISLKKNYHS